MRGEAVPVRLAVTAGDHLLHYRHVNPAERWQSVAMTLDGGCAVAAIPATYTHSPDHLQSFISSVTDGAAVLTPGLSPTVSNQPYALIRQV